MVPKIKIHSQFNAIHIQCVFHTHFAKLVLHFFRIFMQLNGFFVKIGIRSIAMLSSLPI